MNKRIPPQEFLKQPFSVAIRQVIQDVKDLTAVGIDIHMGDWVKCEANGHVCSVCLGGAAIVGYNPIVILSEHDGILDIGEAVGMSYDEANIVTDAFNALRGGNVGSALYIWTGIPHDGIAGIVHNDYDYAGCVEGCSLHNMYEDLERTAAELEAIGY